MKESTKEKKLNEHLAELLGLTPEQIKEKRRGHQADNRAREVQAVFLFLEKPNGFIKKKCDNCHEFFLTTYQFVSVCSAECRIESLEKIGIDWNPLRTPDEIWKRAQIPTEYSIPPKALKVLLELAKSQDYSNPTEENDKLSVVSETISEPLSKPDHTEQPQILDLHKSPDVSPPESTSVLSPVDAELEFLGLL